MNSSKCIYCNEREANERDHVPPKSLFPKPAPSNLITVPACSLCNRGFSKDEEYFRTIVSGLAQTDRHPASQQLRKDKILKGLERRPKLASKIMSTVVPVNLTYKGQLVATVAAFDIDNPSFDNIIVKIIKGLLFHETGLTIHSPYVVNWNVIHKPLEVPPALYERILNEPAHSFGNQVFEYQSYILPGTIASFWLLRFYGGANFHGAVYDPS